MTINSKCVKVNSVNSFYFVFSKVNGYFEVIYKNKCSRLVPTNQNKEKVKKYKELLSKITDCIRVYN